jgi:hypothetical protein
MSLSLLPLAGEGGLKGRMRALKDLKTPSPVSAIAEPPSPTRIALLALGEGTLDRANLCIKTYFYKGPAYEQSE